MNALNNACPVCGASEDKVTTAAQREAVPFGSEGESVSVVLAVHSCAACGQSWTDHQAEVIRDFVVTEALGSARARREEGARHTQGEPSPAHGSAQDGDLTPEQEAFCTRNCCWSGHHKDCARHDSPTAAVQEEALHGAALKRTNVGSDNLSDQDRAAMDQQLRDWIAAGCPEARTDTRLEVTSGIATLLAQWHEGVNNPEMWMAAAAGALSGARALLTDHVRASDSRHEFEQWAVNEGYDTSIDESAPVRVYAAEKTDAAWSGWQAAFAAVGDPGAAPRPA